MVPEAKPALSNKRRSRKMPLTFRKIRGNITIIREVHGPVMKTSRPDQVGRPGPSKESKESKAQDKDSCCCCWSYSTRHIWEKKDEGKNLAKQPDQNRRTQECTRQGRKTYEGIMLQARYVHKRNYLFLDLINCYSPIEQVIKFVLIQLPPQEISHHIPTP